MAVCSARGLTCAAAAGVVLNGGDGSLSWYPKRCYRHDVNVGVRSGGDALPSSCNQISIVA